MLILSLDSLDFKFNINMSVSVLPRGSADFYLSHTEANFKYFSWTLGGGALSARSGARMVVKCTPMDALNKIDAF